MSSRLAEGLAAVLALPRAEQPDAVRALHASLPAATNERWNTAFGPDSLYEAFTRSTVARGAHAANRAALRPLLDARPGFRVLEVGGGNGALWRGLLRPDDHGEIVVVDPHPEGADGVRAIAPPGVSVRHLAVGVEAASLPEADAAVASLVLHHIAGRDAADRARVGLAGSGKREALCAIRAALVPRDGWLLVNEADIYCDLALAPGDPLLRERLCDSYVRRFARSLLVDRANADSDALRARLDAIVRDWALAQLGQADVPYAERDVYELDVVAWLSLFAECGLRLERRGFTDPWLLFHQYVLKAACSTEARELARLGLRR